MLTFLAVGVIVGLCVALLHAEAWGARSYRRERHDALTRMPERIRQLN